MVIGMGVSILIARRGQGKCPLHLYRHIRFPAWEPVIDPYIPLFLPVNKCSGITVKNAQEWVFSLYYFSKWKKWENELCVLEGVSYEVRSTRDETGWAVSFFALLFFLNEKMRKWAMCLWEHEMRAPEFARCYIPEHQIQTCIHVVSAFVVHRNDKFHSNCRNA